MHREKACLFSRCLVAPLALAALVALVVLSVPAQGAPPAASKGAEGKSIKVYTGAELARSGWKTDKPPYPYQAVRRREQGTVYAELTTDATGKVKARTAKTTKHPDLDAMVVTWTQEHWHGPPNADVIVSFAFALQ